YGVRHDTTVLSDMGQSFFEDGKDIFASLGFQHHHSYPGVVQQYLSPNDNRFHGSAKKIWRESGVDFTDDVLSCAYLLNLLDWCTKDARTWFDTNLQLGLQESTLSKVEELLMGTDISESKFF